MSKTIFIGGRIESKAKGNVVTGANAILDDTKGKKQNVINKDTDDELLRLEQSKQDNLTFDNTPTEDSTNPVTSGGVYTAEKALSDAIEAILLLIPSAATALNKLVDTNTMNSSISTATATFRGTYNAVSDLGLTYQATHAQIEAALDALGLTADNNDFAFVQIPISDQSQDIAKTERFKFNGTNWLYEYDLNTSGFTATQWAAINSGITVALVTKLTDLPTAAALQLALNAKQDTLTFDNEPTALSQNPVTSGGIYTAIQAVATALSDYSTTTDGRLNVLEGLIPTEASSSNKLTDKAYVDGLIQAITELIPAEADTTNQLADKAYVLAQILAATPAFKGQFVTLAELQAVASPKAGDLGIVRTKDSDGLDVFTVYQYLSNAWNVYFSLSYHPQTKPATTGTTGDYPYNGMGRVELAKNMVNSVNTLTQDMFYKGAVGSRVPNTNTIFVIRYDYVLAENITIPDNCVLEFDGGSLSGSVTITGQNTVIKAGITNIFNTNLTFDGSWNISEAYPEWFDAKGDGTTNDRVPIQKCIDCFTNIVLTQNYKVTMISDTDADSDDVLIGIRVSKDNVHICSKCSSTISISDTESYQYSILKVIDSSNVSICGIHFIGKKVHIGTEEGWGFGIYLENTKFTNISECEFEEMEGDGIYLHAAFNFDIFNNNIHHCRRQGISVIYGEYGTIKNNEIHHIAGTNPQSGIDLEANPTDIENNRFIREITLENNYIHDMLDVDIYDIANFDKGQDIIVSKGVKSAHIINSKHRRIGTGDVTAPKEILTLTNVECEVFSCESRVTQNEKSIIISNSIINYVALASQFKVFIDGCSLKQVVYKAERYGRNGYLELSNCTIESATDKDSIDIYGTTLAYKEFYMHDCKFILNGGRGIRITGDKVVIKNNIFCACPEATEETGVPLPSIPLLQVTANIGICSGNEYDLYKIKVPNNNRNIIVMNINNKFFVFNELMHSGANTTTGGQTLYPLAIANNNTLQDFVIKNCIYRTMNNHVKNDSSVTGYIDGIVYDDTVVY